MKSLMSDLLRSILLDRGASLRLKEALDQYRSGNEHVTFEHNGKSYKITLLQHREP